jgi:phage terminase large subunit-like protein
VSETLDLLHALVMEDGRRWGEVARRWQLADAAAILDATGPRLHYLTRPRGASKTTDLAAVAIVALLRQLPPRSRSYAAAADADQAALLLDALAGFVARTGGLAATLRLETSKVTVPGTGATLEVLAADEASSWGLKPALLIVDEFAAFPFGRYQ